MLEKVLGVFRRYGFAATIASVLAVMTLVVLGKSAVDAVTGGDAAKAAPAQQAQGKGKAKGGPGGGQVPGVTAVAATRHTFSDAIQALGTAQARESIILTPKAADTIRALRFDSGQRVRRGQVLVEMASVEQSADLSEARAANDAAQADLARAQSLFQRGFYSQAGLDRAQAAADTARARMQAGGSRVADRTIRAPFSGVVGLRTASPGQYMRPGDEIGTLDDISQIKLDFDVPETRLAQLRNGVAIISRTAAYPDRTFEGRISQVDSRVNPTTRTVRVRAILPNPRETLRPGMLMTVEVRSNPRAALAVPEIAVLEQADGSFVYAVKADGQQQRAELTRVRTGQRSGGMTEVLDGLADGELVVTEGVQNLRPGQPVRVQQPNAASGGNQRAGEAAPALRPRG